MKYFVLTVDGMADRRMSACGGKSPMEVAAKPTMNMLSYRSFNGFVSNLPEGAADVPYAVDLSVLGCDPSISCGTAVYEAASLGAALTDEDTVYKCAFLSLSEDDCDYADRKVLSAHPSDVTAEEITRLVSAVNKGISTKIKKFYAASDLSACLVWRRSPKQTAIASPEEAEGKRTGDLFPDGDAGARIVPMLEKSYTVLKDHPVNVRRREQGKAPLNSIWLWGGEKKPAYDDFGEKWRVSPSIISEDAMLTGIGALIGMKPVKASSSSVLAKAAIDEFTAGADLVYVHYDGVRKASLAGDAAAKVAAIEEADSVVLAPVYEYLCGCGDQFKLLVSTGTAIPCETRAYEPGPAPFFMYNSMRTEVGYKPFSELNAAKSGFCLPEGHKFVPFMIRLPAPAPEKEETPEQNGQQ